MTLGRTLFLVLFFSGIAAITTNASELPDIVVNESLNTCFAEKTSPTTPVTQQSLTNSKHETALSQCVVEQRDAAIADADRTKLEEIWITLQRHKFSSAALADQNALSYSIERAAWNILQIEIDTALNDKDLSKTESLIQSARVSIYEGLSQTDGPREGAGLFELTNGRLWTEYRHGRNRLLLRITPTFKAEGSTDPCLRITNVAILDQSKTPFKKGRNVRLGSGGSPNVGVGGSVGGGSRSGVGGGVGVSIDLTPLFGGGGDGRISRIYRMDDAVGATNQWSIVGTFRNQCARTKETFSIPVVPGPEQQPPSPSDIAVPPAD